MRLWLLIPFLLTSIYDGDTLTGTAVVWPGVSVQSSVRLRGIDAPEMRGDCESERLAAIDARDRLIELLAVGDGVVWIAEPKHGKYAGRTIGTVFSATGVDVAAVLLEEKLVKPYNGRGPRPEWCAVEGDA